MAATVARPHIFNAFLAPATDSRQFFHGHTFGGNPLAAAAAMASLDLLTKPSFLETVATKGEYLRNRISGILSDHPHVGDIRGRCMMVGIELVADRSSRQPFSSKFQLGRAVCRRTVQNGVWIRPLGDVIILMPPLIATESELDMLATVVAESINAETMVLVEQATEISSDA